MASRRTQFLQRMPIPKFLLFFSTKVRRVAAEKASRWPAGFNCPRCSPAAHYAMDLGGRELFHCKGCRHHTSPTLGRLIEQAKPPRMPGFLPNYLRGQAATCASASALKRQIGVSYFTAWLLHQTIFGAKARQDSTQQLGGAVQLEDAVLVGAHTGDKPGRGSKSQMSSAAAVSLNNQGKPVYPRLNLVRGFTLDLINAWAQTNFAPQARVTSICFAWFAVVKAAIGLFALRVRHGVKALGATAVASVATGLATLALRQWHQTTLPARSCL